MKMTLIQFIQITQKIFNNELLGVQIKKQNHEITNQ